MTSRCCWWIQPASATTRNRSGYESGTIGARVSDAPSGVFWEAETPQAGQRSSGRPLAAGFDRVFGQYGMLFVSSGYGALGFMAENVLLAFSVDGQ